MTGGTAHQPRFRLKILMYHAVGEPGEPAGRFVVPVRAFERQVAWLERAHFPVVRLESALQAIQAGESLPRRALAITFDDGTFDVGALALPILERHGFPATAFVVTQAMGSAASWTNDAGLCKRPLMTWTEALRLPPLISLAPHSRTHPSLPSLDDRAVAAEIRGSREDLERQGIAPLNVFAYPYGHYDERVAAVAAEAGYAGACTVRPGVNDRSTPPYELRRYEIRGDEPLATFVLNVSLDLAYRAVRFWDRRPRWSSD
jgi:peptidoglycan/xylan/chitin deacetylase (PgdA/CDA1 family)